MASWKFTVSRSIVCALLVCQPVWPAQEAKEQKEKPSEQVQTEPANFKFTKIELELLERVNQLEKKLQDDGVVLAEPELEKYLTFVGQAVLRDIPPPENVTWRFRIARDPEANAFALPNGLIYVTTGLLARLDNEAQLASVLAHEATHVLARHSYREYRSYRKKMVAIHVFQAVATFADMTGGIAGATVAAVASMIPMILVGTIYGYSRELETEADVRAVRALVEADYSAEEMPNALKLLTNRYEVDLSEGEIPVFYSSHPRLNERISYITALVNSIRPKTAHPMVEAERYTAQTEKAVRHDVGLEIQVGRARTAVAFAQRLVKQNPAAAENHFLLGEAYRALGPRTQQPQPDETTSDAKKKTRKMIQKMTLREYETALMSTPQGQSTCRENDKLAEEAYQKALEVDSAFARAYRGLGFLYDRAGNTPQAIEAFKKYLEAAPGAMDRNQIVRRVETLEKATTPPPVPQP